MCDGAERALGYTVRPVDEPREDQPPRCLVPPEDVRVAVAIEVPGLDDLPDLPDGSRSSLADPRGLDAIPLCRPSLPAHRNGINESPGSSARCRLQTGK